MKKNAKKSSKKDVNNKFNKESALKALAKCPPKLFEAMSKGGHTIHDLKKIGRCSGGKIRKMVWAGIAEILEDKTIKLVKGIKKSDLPDVDPTPIKEKRAAKKEARAAKDRPAKKHSRDEEDDRPAKKSHKEKERHGKKALRSESKSESGTKVKKLTVKLLRPVSDIPANHPVQAEYDGAFYWVNQKRIAHSNIQIIK